MDTILTLGNALIAAALAALAVGLYLLFRPTPAAPPPTATHQIRIKTTKRGRFLLQLLDLSSGDVVMMQCMPGCESMVEATEMVGRIKTMHVAGKVDLR